MELKALQQEINRFASPENQVPIVIHGKFDPDQQAWIETIEVVPECPSEWGLLIGALTGLTVFSNCFSFFHPPIISRPKEAGLHPCRAAIRAGCFTLDVRARNAP